LDIALKSARTNVFTVSLAMELPRVCQVSGLDFGAAILAVPALAVGVLPVALPVGLTLASGTLPFAERGALFETVFASAVIVFTPFELHGIACRLKSNAGLHYSNLT
jgi:hypothetical protein